MEFVYFAEYDHNPNVIYIGTTTDGGSRQRAHNHARRTMIAFTRGGAAEEVLLQEGLKDFRVDPRIPADVKGEYVRPYIEWLVAKSLFFTTLELAAHGPELPYSMWGFPQFNPLEFEIIGEPRERIARAHHKAWLQSLSDEWYTPQDIIEIERWVFEGEITTDPASCAVAQEYIKARAWGCKSVSGLERNFPWRGNVHLNPPYGTGEASAGVFCERLVAEWLQGNIKQAITILNVNSITSNWFRPLWSHATAHLILYGRLYFLNALGARNDMGSPTKGTIISYFGPNADRFMQGFAGRGVFVVTKGEPELQISMFRKGQNGTAGQAAGQQQ